MFYITSGADSHSNASAEFSENFGASLHESQQPSSLLASASCERPANHNGVGCSKAEPGMEQVGEEVMRG